jgi:GDP-4-dehydro-6-deoxy-D-mannose reductase
MSTRALVTGMGGFAGSHLAEHLIQEGLSVHGTVVSNGDADPDLARLARSALVHRCDIRSYAAVSELVATVEPGVIFHLAAVSSVPYGEEHPDELFAVNLSGTLHVLEAASRYAPGCTVVVISSPEVYGKVASEECPIKEERPLRPVHSYGLSKALAEEVALFYHRQRGLSVVILRPFNHIGPRQADSFVCSNFCKQAALIDLGRMPPVMRVGNLSSVRDFTDVRDVVRGYRLAAERCKSGRIYHIASGTGTSIRDVLNIVLSFVDMEIEVEQDPSRLRTVETPVFIGDASRFAAETGWRPRISLSQSLYDCFTYWRERVVRQAPPTP